MVADERRETWIFLLEMRFRTTNDQLKNANFSSHFKFAIIIFKRLWPRNEILFWLVYLCIVIKRGWFEITSRQIRQNGNFILESTTPFRNLLNRSSKNFSGSRNFSCYFLGFAHSKRSALLVLKTIYNRWQQCPLLCMKSNENRVSINTTVSLFAVLCARYIHCIIFHAVHTDAFSFENAYFWIRFRLSSTL